MLKTSITKFDLFHPDANLDVFFKMYKDAGIDGIDFSFDYLRTCPYAPFGRQFFKKSIDEIKKILSVYKNAFEKHGIVVAQTHSPSPIYKFDPNEQEYNDYLLETTKKCIELTAWLGAKYIVVHPAHDSSIALYDEERPINIKFFSQMIDTARRFGVTVCLENMWADKGGRIFDSSCSDPYEACDYIDTLNDMAGEELFAFCFDVGHANICGRHMQNTLRVLGKRVKTLHIHDTDGMNDNHTVCYACASPGGRPMTDYEGFLAGLRDIGYDGYLNFEVVSAFNIFPKPTHQALCKLIKATGDYFSSQIEK